MPGPHRRFLEHLTKVANIRDYVEANRADATLANSYDDCLRALSSFRDKHLQIVSRYIVIMSQESKRKSAAAAAAAAGESDSPTAGKPHPGDTAGNLGLAKDEASKKDLKGTGGTQLMPFLKQSRDETMEPAIGTWSKVPSNFESFQARSKELTPPSTPGSTPCSSSPISGFAVRSCKVNDIDDMPASRNGVGMAGNWEIGDDMGGICHY